MHEEAGEAWYENEQFEACGGDSAKCKEQLDCVPTFVFGRACIA